MERRAQTAIYTTEESSWPLAGTDALSHALLRELGEGSREQRVRAATRLEAFLGLEAIPHLCEALAVEEDAQVLASLCASLARLGEAEALPGIRAHLGAVDPAVRSAALEACIRLSRAEEERLALIEEGLADSSASVRRRTFLAAAAIPGMELAPWALRFRRDGDPHLRRLAYVTLATSPDASIASTALDAFLDPDEGVRTAAAAALERWLGESVRALDALSANEVRREIAALKTRMSSAPTQSAPRPRARPEPKEARVESPAIAFADIERVLLAAIRGMHLRDLAAELGEEEAKVGASVQTYLVEGRLVLRGTKLYLP